MTCVAQVTPIVGPTDNCFFKDKLFSSSSDTNRKIVNN